ncbi:sarcosine oxidase subunit delta [Acidocella sp.]|uniref:sarcosine oxidase subunit delta n=1 Tax=Acidocella sp. TaxID=50710 RepID=UPI00260C171D|nr:sarcosine oxidase subunit delta [Acidocella sp.]
MRIECPYCGPRGAEEFVYTQDAERARPTDGGASPTEDWAAYVYLRDNLPGARREYWYHQGGCRAWLKVTRDVSTHEILKVELP